MEVEKREDMERETEETEHSEDYYNVHTALFAAGTALLVACLKRAIMACFVEQWRSWVFLILNIVLLAILFTSIRPNSSNQEKSNGGVEFQIERKKKREQCSRLVVTEKCGDCCEIDKNGSRMKEGEQDEDDVELPRLSKEELNERVEAFISMFRQHLVSDAKKL